MITVFGSINLDMVMPVDNLPQPGETVLGENYLMIPGGKGANQACAAALAGSQVAIYGQVGEDSFATEALRLLDENGVDLSGVIHGDRPTGCATIWVDASGENAIVVASGANMNVSAKDVPDSALTKDHYLLLQMEIDPKQNWALIDRAHAKGAKTMLSVAPAGIVPGHILEKVDILLFNELEGQAVAQSIGMDETTPTRLPRAMSERYGLTCILTLGGAGSLCFSPEGGWMVPALPISPVDSTGAGDAFAGTLAASLDQGLAIDEALKWAAVTSGITCMSKGSQNTIPARDVVESEMDRLPPIKKLA